MWLIRLGEQQSGSTFHGDGKQIVQLLSERWATEDGCNWIFYASGIFDNRAKGGHWIHVVECWMLSQIGFYFRCWNSRN